MAQLKVDEEYFQSPELLVKDTVQVAVFDPHEVNAAVWQHRTEEALLFMLHE